MAHLAYNIVLKHAYHHSILNSYLQYSAVCARVVRQVLKGDLRVEAAKRDEVFIRKVDWKDGKPISKLPKFFFNIYTQCDM